MELSFAHLGLSEPLLRALGELGHSAPTPIQMTSIPVILSGRDLLGQAQTGTGKTGAFALPLLSGLELKTPEPQVLVLAPTRELAIQVAEAFKAYARFLPAFRVAAVYGGQSMTVQLKELKGKPQVIVGTPGRVLDHIRRKSLDISKIRSLVLDEADEMLKMGFKEELETILQETPEEKQVVLFSATMPKEIRLVASQHLRDAEEIIIKTKTATVEAIRQLYCSVTNSRKLDALARILEVREIDAAIIFVKTKAATLEVCEALESRGHSVAALNGDLTQTLRENTINRLKRGQIKLVVATDVAARGLHVDNIDHIINYDMPRDTESYVHRIGRTGRAGKSGTAILFVTPRETKFLRKIEKATRQPLEELPLPGDEVLVRRRIEVLKARVYEILGSNGDLAPYEQVVREIQGQGAYSAETIGAALCCLLQADAPLLFRKGSPAANTGRSSADRLPAERERERGPRAARRQESDSAHDDDAKGQLHRLPFGRLHGVEVGQIVATVCNVTGLTNRHIGNIRLHDEYSTVELPPDVPASALRALAECDFGLDAGRTRERRHAGKDRRPEKKAGRRDQTAEFSGRGKERKRPEGRGGQHKGRKEDRRERPSFDKKGRKGKK